MTPHMPPDCIPLLAEAADRGVVLRWVPTGLDVTLQKGPIPAHLLTQITERSDEIRAVLYRAQVDYSTSPPTVIDPNTGDGWPLTRKAWQHRDKTTGWPS